MKAPETNKIYTSGQKRLPGSGTGRFNTPATPAASTGDGSGLGYWKRELKTPITADVGLSDQERQGIYNLARGQTQSATNAAAGEMEQKLSGQGFRPGESGIADSALGKIYSQGAQSLGDFGQQIASKEASDRFAQNMDLNNANLQRLTGGGGLALGELQSENTLAGVQAQIAAANKNRTGSGAGQAAKSAWDINQANLAFDREQLAQQGTQFGENLGYQKTGQTMGFFNDLLRNQAGYEQPVYANYAQGMTF